LPQPLDQGGTKQRDDLFFSLFFRETDLPERRAEGRLNVPGKRSLPLRPAWGDEIGPDLIDRIDEGEEDLRLRVGAECADRPEVIAPMERSGVEEGGKMAEEADPLADAQRASGIAQHPLQHRRRDAPSIVAPLIGVRMDPDRLRRLQPEG